MNELHCARSYFRGVSAPRQHTTEKQAAHWPANRVKRCCNGDIYAPG